YYHFSPYLQFRTIERRLPLMSRSIADIAESYMTGWKNKDIGLIAKDLHPDVHYKGPMAERTGREGLVAGMSRLLPILIDVHVRSKFVGQNQTFYAYDFVCKEPIGLSRIAELLTFEDGKIKSIELFFDARPWAA